MKNSSEGKKTAGGKRICRAKRSRPKEGKGLSAGERKVESNWYRRKQIKLSNQTKQSNLDQTKGKKFVSV